MPTHAFTVQKLANAAGVGVEAIRYYQRRGLLAEPSRAGGGFRQYTDDDVRRLRFIKRAQELGFSLDDVAELASLSTLKDRAVVRKLARLRASEMRERAAQLNSMAAALEDLADSCARGPASRGCPIMASLVGESAVASVSASGFVASERRRSALDASSLRRSAA